MNLRARTLPLSILFLSVLVLAVPMGANAAESKGATSRHHATLFGLEFAVLFQKSDSLDEERIFDEALSELKTVKEVLSPLSFEKDKPLALNAEGFAMLEKLKRVQERSEGAVSVSAAALEDAYVFEGSAKSRPDVNTLKKALEDAQARLVLDPLTRSGTLDRSMTVDFRRLMKGFALDRVGEVLKSNGVENALVTLGGMAKVLGTRGDESWTLGVSDPRSEGYFATLQIIEGALSTRSDNDRFFNERDSEGQKSRVHDVIDARDGLPAKLSRSATVCASDATSAELFAQALFVLGPKEGMRLINDTRGVEALLVDANNRVTLSSGIEKKCGLKMRAPTP